MSPNVYLCIVSSICIAYCFIRIAISIVFFFLYRPALIYTSGPEGGGAHLTALDLWFFMPKTLNFFNFKWFCRLRFMLKHHFNRKRVKNMRNTYTSRVKTFNDPPNTPPTHNHWHRLIPPNVKSWIRHWYRHTVCTFIILFHKGEGCHSTLLLY